MSSRVKLLMYATILSMRLSMVLVTKVCKWALAELCDRGQATVVHLLYGLEAGEASCNEFVVLEHGSYLAFDTVAGVSSRLTVNQLG